MEQEGGMKITYADVFNGSNTTDRVRIEADKTGAKIYFGKPVFPREEKYIMLQPYHIKDLYKEVTE